RAAFVWPLVGGLMAALTAAVEAWQTGPLNASLVFVLGVASMFVLCLAVAWLYRFRRIVACVLLAWVVVCLVREGYLPCAPPHFAPLEPPPRAFLVQLRGAPLSDGLGPIAEHCWFLVCDPDTGEVHRWELWEHANRCRTSWDHVHQDLLDADDDVGGGPMHVASAWRGEAARRLGAHRAEAPEHPYRRRHLPWPGPNSNTYIAWVLKDAGVPWDMEPKCIGKDYLGTAGVPGAWVRTVGVGITTTGTGVQAESPLLGLKVGLRDGLELHLLCFTFGLDAWPPGLKTPLRRF